MSYELESQTVSTPAGDYTVRWIQDEDAEQPYDEGFGLVRLGGREYHDVVTDVAHAAEVASLIGYHSYDNARQGNIYDYEIRSSAAVARYLRLKYGLKGIVQVDSDFRASEPSADRGESFVGLAWAPDDAMDHEEYTRLSLTERRAWAEGDVFGWVVENPSGDEIESVWGYYGFDTEREYTLSEALSVIKTDVIERVEQVNLVGAGIVSLI